MCVPFGDKSQQAFSQVFLVSKIRHPPPCALQNRAPLLHLVHPGARNGGKVEDKAWRLAQPCLDLFPLVHPEIIQHHVHRRDGGGNVPLQMLQKGDTFHLPFALRRGGVACASARVKARAQV